MAHKHPANIDRHDNASLGGRAADRVARFMGSWRFIGIQTGVIICWIVLNVLVVAMRWDAYPFILLNLLFSTQAAYAAPILQLASNRAAEHDRIKAESDYRTNEMSLSGIRNILLLMHGDAGDLEEASDGRPAAG